MTYFSTRLKNPQIKTSNSFQSQHFKRSYLTYRNFSFICINASRLSIVQHNNADKRQSAVNLNVFITTSLRNIQAIDQQISIAKASKDIDKRWLWKRFYQIRRSIAILRSEDYMNPFYKVELQAITF